MEADNIRVTRSLRKRINSIDSEGSRRPETPVGNDLKLNEENSKTPKKVSPIIGTPSRKTRRTSQTENEKTPAKTRGRTQNLILSDFSPVVVASPIRTTRRSINSNEANNINNKFQKIDTVVEEDGENENISNKKDAQNEKKTSVKSPSKALEKATKNDRKMKITSIIRDDSDEDDVPLNSFIPNIKENIDRELGDNDITANLSCENETSTNDNAGKDSKFKSVTFNNSDESEKSPKKFPKTPTLSKGRSFFDENIESTRDITSSLVFDLSTTNSHGESSKESVVDKNKIISPLKVLKSNVSSSTPINLIKEGQYSKGRNPVVVLSKKFLQSNVKDQSKTEYNKMFVQKSDSEESDEDTEDKIDSTSFTINQSKSIINISTDNNSMESIIDSSNVIEHHENVTDTTNTRKSYSKNNTPKKSKDSEEDTDMNLKSVKQIDKMGLSSSLVMSTKNKLSAKINSSCVASIVSEYKTKNLDKSLESNLNPNKVKFEDSKTEREAKKFDKSPQKIPLEEINIRESIYMKSNSPKKDSKNKSKSESIESEIFEKSFSKIKLMENSGDYIINMKDKSPNKNSIINETSNNTNEDDEPESKSSESEIFEQSSSKIKMMENCGDSIINLKDKSLDKDSKINESLNNTNEDDESETESSESEIFEQSSSKIVLKENSGDSIINLKDKSLNKDSKINETLNHTIEDDSTESMKSEEIEKSFSKKLLVKISKGTPFIDEKQKTLNEKGETLDSKCDETNKSQNLNKSCSTDMNSVSSNSEREISNDEFSEAEELEKISSQIPLARNSKRKSMIEIKEKSLNKNSRHSMSADLNNVHVDPMQFKDLHEKISAKSTSNTSDKSNSNASFSSVKKSGNENSEIINKSDLSEAEELEKLSSSKILLKENDKRKTMHTTIEKELKENVNQSRLSMGNNLNDIHVDEAEFKVLREKLKEQNQNKIFSKSLQEINEHEITKKLNKSATVGERTAKKQINVDHIMERCNIILEEANKAKREFKLQNKLNKPKKLKPKPPQKADDDNNNETNMKRLKTEDIAKALKCREQLIKKKLQHLQESVTQDPVKSTKYITAEVLENLPDKKPKKSKLKEPTTESKELKKSDSNDSKKRKHKNEPVNLFENASGTFMETTLATSNDKSKIDTVAKKRKVISKQKPASGLFYEEPITPETKKFFNGFKESLLTPEPTGYKIRNILAAGQKERKSKKCKILKPINEPTMILPKPKWTSSGEFVEEKIITSIKNLEENIKTDFHVVPLIMKKSHKASSAAINSKNFGRDIRNNALEFKKFSMQNSNVHRETSKEILQRKERQNIRKKY